MTPLEQLQSGGPAEVEYVLMQLEHRAQEKLKYLQQERDRAAKQKVLAQWAPRLRELHLSIATDGSMPELDEVVRWLDEQIKPPTPTKPPAPPDASALFTPSGLDPTASAFFAGVGLFPEAPACAPKQAAPTPAARPQAPAPKPTPVEAEVLAAEVVVLAPPALPLPPVPEEPLPVIRHPHQDEDLYELDLPRGFQDELEQWFTLQKEWAEQEQAQPTLASINALGLEVKVRVLAMRFVDDYYSAVTYNMRAPRHAFGAVTALVRMHGSEIPPVRGLKREESYEWRPLLLEALAERRTQREAKQRELDAQQRTQAAEREREVQAQDRRRIAAVTLEQMALPGLDREFFRGVVRDYLRVKGDLSTPAFLTAVAPQLAWLDGPEFKSVRRKLAKQAEHNGDDENEAPTVEEPDADDAAEEAHVPEVERWRGKLANRRVLLLGSRNDEARAQSLREFFGITELEWPNLEWGQTLPEKYAVQVSNGRYDCVVVITSAVRHSTQDKLKAACDKTGVPLVLARKVSLAQIAIAMTAAHLRV